MYVVRQEYEENVRNYVLFYANIKYILKFKICSKMKLGKEYARKRNIRLLISAESDQAKPGMSFLFWRTQFCCYQIRNYV